MSGFDLQKIGEAIRNFRKERGLRLEDLADENISVSTISNIERGFTHVKEEKIAYLLEKLKINLDELHKFEEMKQTQEQRIALEIKAIETWIASRNINRALKALARLKLPKQHPLEAQYHLLKGRCYVQKNQLEKAVQEYIEAIRLAKWKGALSQLALCYSELGQCYIQLHDLGQALECVREGLQLYHEGLKKDMHFYLLKLREIECLQKLEREGEVHKIIHAMWEEVQQIPYIDFLLQFYCLRVELLRSMDQYEEAIAVAEKGIDLARYNREYDWLGKLWTLLGNLYYSLRKHDLAKFCFQTVVSLENRLQDQSLLVGVYIQLGMVYLQEQNVSDAEQMMLRAIEIGKEEENQEKLIHALFAMGEVQKKKDPSLAIQYLQEAKELARKTGNSLFEYKASIRLAKIYRDLDYARFVQEAVEMYDLQVKLEEQTTAIY